MPKSKKKSKVIVAVESNPLEHVDFVLKDGSCKLLKVYLGHGADLGKLIRTTPEAKKQGLHQGVFTEASQEIKFGEGPQLSTAKRQLRAQVFNATMSHLEKKLLQKDLQIEKLGRDKPWLPGRENEEKEEKGREGDT
ncbi:hypothetical protein K443DRAFT_126455 [Laccaria amethystina LaAM-08-1]|uniref:Uncharacterized protein n=1 Tax=Laccaria amethystina LaAM-08-1 TaxID=1095629 RepID=A0A0C9WLV7_9AGAR|nr:hypothetical protein K443DRAFT_126455 [Laccaria amethystina LaAM-08-1]